MRLRWLVRSLGPSALWDVLVRVFEGPLRYLVILLFPVLLSVTARISESLNRVPVEVTQSVVAVGVCILLIWSDRVFRTRTVNSVTSSSTRRELYQHRTPWYYYDSLYYHACNCGNIENARGISASRQSGTGGKPQCPNCEALVERDEC